MTEGYSLGNAERCGWGPDDPPDSIRLEVLQEYCLGQEVLDIGCATGTYVDWLNRLGRTTVGVDGFLDFLHGALERNRSGQFVAGRAEQLPFADKTFDTSVIFAVLEHVDDRAAVREAIRVTRHRIIALVPLTDPSQLLDNGFVFHHHRDRTHLREYTVNDLRALFEERGCAVVAVRYAYPANVRGMLADSLRLPAPFRFATRGVLRLVKFAFRPHYSEAFIVADVPDSEPLSGSEHRHEIV